MSKCYSHAMQTSPNTMDQQAKTWNQMTMMTQEEQDSKKREDKTMAHKNYFHLSKIYLLLFYTIHYPQCIFVYNHTAMFMSDL